MIKLFSSWLNKKWAEKKLSFESQDYFMLNGIKQG